MTLSFLLLTAIFFPLLLSPFFFVFAKITPRFLGFLSMIPPTLSTFFFLLIGNQVEWTKPTLVSIEWIPLLNISFSFLIDGLSLFYGFLVSIMGILVCLYSQGYMTHRKSHLGRFYFYLLFFMTAMLACVFSNNLILLFIFFELTSVASFLLIGYHYEEEKAIDGAKTAFLVTSFTSLFLLVGLILLYVNQGTYSFVELKPIDPSASFLQNLSFILIAIGIFGKSAQFPFFFWLPKAMVAPTPVSAYLHAATMVKLGIFLTARIYPIFVGIFLWFPLITSICFLTMLLGAVLSLLSNDLKAILAYATVSQLGFFLGFYGMGGVQGVEYDFIHILNHAFYKGALFMLVGVIQKATGIQDIRYLGGLFKKIPFTACIFLIASAAMAGIPGSTGFISKELFLNRLLLFGSQYPIGWIIFSIVFFASLFQVTFSIRFFTHIFIRFKKEDPHEFFQPPSFFSQLSPLILSVAALYFGLYPPSLNFVVQNFYVEGLHLSKKSELHFLDIGSLELMISFSILLLGTIFFLLAEKTAWSFAKIPHFLRFDHIFSSIYNWIQDFSIKLSDLVFLKKPSVALFAFLGFFVVFVGGWSFSHFLTIPVQFPKGFLFPELLRFFIAFATISVTIMILFLSSQLGKLIAVSTAGFFITLYYVFFEAPDLAMTQLLVEVATLFFVVFFLKGIHKKEISSSSFHKKMQKWISLGVGLTATLLSSLILYDPLENRLGQFFLENSFFLARGTNVVNAILLDFRGLDTFGEITVLVLATLGVFGLWKKTFKEKQLFMEEKK